MADTLVSARRVQPRAFPQLLRSISPVVGTVSNLGGLAALVERFVGKDAVETAFGKFEHSAQIDSRRARVAERLVAGVVGTPSARALMASALSGSSQDELDQVALRLNTRPRKTLGFRTPADTFEQAVALTG